MAIIPPLLARSGLLEVMLGTGDNSVIIVDENEAEDQLLQDRIGAPITKLAVAPNGRFLACYRKDGVLTVMSTNFTTKVLDFDTMSMSRPMDIAWCGEDAIVLRWKNTGIVMVGPYGDWLNFPYEGAVHLVAEQDGCRIITGGICEMMQRVPASTEAIRRIGSTDPAALLYDAMEAFEEGDPKSDENIRSIAASSQLNDAVSSCLGAASAEFDMGRQQALLKAASYGKAFSTTNSDPTEFVETAKKLRVLNHIRDPKIGLPLTINQYNMLTPDVLVNRLTMRNHHFLAIRMCEVLKLSNSGVLSHWAAEKVKRMAVTSATDEEISNTIRKRVECYGRVSYLEIAKAAYNIGRRRLATIILELEHHASDQVPLLLSMQEEELALQKAIASDDTELIYLAVLHLENVYSDDTETFYRLIHVHPEAVNLLKVFYRHKVSAIDRGVLHSLLVYSKNFIEASTAAIHQSFLQTTLQARLSLMKEAVQLSSYSKDLAYLKTLTEAQMELLEFQKTLELRTNKKEDIIGMSMTETITKLIVLGIEDPADASRWNTEINKMLKKFHVSEKLHWNIRIHCYSNNNKWDLLMAFANEKKSVVGYAPFARACIKHHQPNSETEKYIEKIPSLEDRFDLYCEVPMFRKAAETAFKLKDIAKLEAVARQCTDSSLVSQIMDMIKRL